MNQYYYFPCNGEICTVSEHEANSKMNEISNQWEDESTKFGKLFMGVYDWDFDEVTLDLKIPNLRTGGQIPINKKASLFFGFDIFGDCFLKPELSQIPNIDAKITENNKI
jgi:hypothetical protein